MKKNNFSFKVAFFAAVGLALFISTNYLNAQDYHSIVGQIVEADTGIPVENATIIVLQDEISTLSASDGQFKLRIKKGNKPTRRLHCYRVGYYDTIISWKLSQKQLQIHLRPKPYELDEVVVSAKRPKEKYQIGSYDVALRHGKDFKAPSGSYSGAYVKNKRKYKNTVLASLSFHIADAGKLGGSFAIRIVIPTKKVTPNKLESVNTMLDVLKEPVICTVTKRGWNKVDLREQQISLPDKDFFILLAPILEKEMKPSDRMFISVYDSRPRRAAFYFAGFFEDRVFYSNPRRFGGSLCTVPALVLHCEKY